VQTAPVTGPGGQGIEPMCCIQGRGFNKIAEQLLASQEWTVLHGVIC
jgi:predicted fused transcriptional regulator/phosphomethylpyrimidine kinase